MSYVVEKHSELIIATKTKANENEFLSAVIEKLSLEGKTSRTMREQRLGTLPKMERMQLLPVQLINKNSASLKQI
ncbi:CLUMA_CG004630, isoform A [Clunio marinus]|uniref:CLUMA_CG004630, isoform A n=1 Tax=Clunio marinus TaxID=568069 RepID=A0A1J1HSF9_9DIPT|nr:CLUMA_CG004630, isoform A [Clunio marinus]